MKIRTLHTCTTWLMLLLLTTLFGACHADDGEFSATHAMSVSITLQPSRLLSKGTRASDPGIAALNENIIKNVDLFLYAKGHEDEEAVFSQSLTIDASSYNEDNQQATLSLDIPIDAYYTLFPSADVTECTAYAIVNREEPSGNAGDNDNVLPTSKTIASLKSNTVLYASGFDDTSGNPKDVKPQESFVMDGQATLDRENRTLSGNIPVSRVAAKVTLEMTIEDEVKDDNGVTWVPDRDHIYVSFRGMMLRTKLGMTPTENKYVRQENDTSRIDAIKMQNTGGKITLRTPFYTYPADWREDESNRQHMVLVINWKQEDDDSNTQLTYYEVPVNDIQGYVQRNNYYRIIQQVGVLGSTEEETAVTLTPSYIILNWGNSMTAADGDNTDTDATISKLKYLVVDETDIIMSNTMEENIIYFSSNPIEVSALTVKHMDASDEIAQYISIPLNTASISNEDGKRVYTYTGSGTGKNALKEPISITLQTINDETYITFQHGLNNSMTQSADYTDYQFELIVRHMEDDTYKETIKITQYPMIPIRAERNSDYKVDNISNNDNNNQGYLIINNQTGNSGWSAVRGLVGTNKNPNRYIISVTSLTTNDFVIGDPRSLDIKTFNFNKDDRDQSLTNYHATDRSDRTKRMISPQFMVASSYGVCQTTLSLDDAEKRCAAYQEDGYPAGRWRVPTQAEVEYIIQLSEWQIIPVLFNNETYYWSAHGTVMFNGTSFSYGTSNTWVRCVYDTWYWGTDQLSDKNEFVYGD